MMIEALGYDDYDQYGQHYGEKKDNSALALLDAHFAQIYVAREQARDGDPESLYTWYQKNAKYIGKNAPLLTETQYGVLMELLMTKPGKSFELMMKDLAVNFDFYGFKDRNDAIKFQELFGIEIDRNYLFTGYGEMTQWWTNYRNSKFEIINDKINLFKSELDF
ncbi:hypothetical protein [Candidatus Lokiarchaeum ossiferum]